jgi:hypothetical protein
LDSSRPHGFKPGKAEIRVRRVYREHNPSVPPADLGLQLRVWGSERMDRCFLGADRRMIDPDLVDVDVVSFERLALSDDCGTLT